MTTTHAPHPRHDWQSPEYVDHWISTDVTRDEERKPRLRRLATFIPFPFEAPIRVLDIGAGYGALSQQVLEVFPNASVVCHDFSEPMFEHARQRLAWAGPRVSFMKADLREASWTVRWAVPTTRSFPPSPFITCAPRKGSGPCIGRSSPWSSPAAAS